MRRLIVTTAAFIILPWAALGAPRQACPAAKLKLQNCDLRLGPYQIRVWKDKFSVRDKFRRSLSDLPFKDAEWVEVSVQELGNRTFLEFVVWNPPAGEGEVQSKNWYVYELTNERAALKLVQLVQRRKKVDENRYKYDRLEKFGLRLENKKVVWQAAKEKGHIE